MSLYEQLPLTSLLEMSDHIREKPLLGRRESLMERLPSISENQPLIMSRIGNDLLTSNRQSRSSIPDASLPFHPLPSSSTCVSLPANITDLSALLSHLKLNSGNSCYQLDQRTDVCPPKLSRSMSEPHHHHQSLESLGGLLSPNVFNTKFTPNIFDLQALSNDSSNANGNNNPVSNSCCRYKTELCRPFEENGSCKYGEKCQFAHGKHELRSLARHPKYKTDLCKTYHTTGLCPYGPRCHFIHNDEERHLNLINRLVLEHQRQQVLADQQNSKLLRQKQLLLAAAISSQRQQSQPSMLTRQMSFDSSAEQLSALLNLHSTISSLQSSQTLPHQCWQTPQTSLPNANLYQQMRHLPCSSLNSSSDSPSSSITDSPSPSPTSLEEPTMTKNLPAFQTVLETLLKINRTPVFN